MLQQKQIALSSESTIDINERCISLQPGFSQEILTEIIPEILKESGIVFISANSSLQNGILTSLSSTLSASPIPTHFFIETNEPQNSPFIHFIQATKKASQVLKGKALLESLKNKTKTPQGPATEQDWVNSLAPYIKTPNQPQLIIISTPSIIEGLSSKIPNLTPKLSAPLSQMINYTNGRGRQFLELESTVSISDPEDPNLQLSAFIWRDANGQASLKLSSFDVTTREYIAEKPHGLDVRYEDISAISRMFNTITLYGTLEHEPISYDTITIQFVNDSNPIIPLPVTDNVLDLNSICLLSDAPHYAFRSIQATVSALHNTYDEVIIAANPATKSLLFDTMILWDGQFNGIFIENGYRPNENHAPSRVTVFHDPLLWSLEPKMNAWKKEINSQSSEALFLDIENTISTFKTTYSELISDTENLDTILSTLKTSEPNDQQELIDTFRGVVLPELWTQLWDAQLNRWSESNPEKKRLIIVSDSTNLEPLKTLRNEHIK